MAHILSSILLWTFIGFSTASELKDEEDIQELKVFRGKFDGECIGDGLYYMDEHSFIMCNSKNYYIQPCPPGTMNRPYDGYLSGSKYDFENFCDINLVNFGYTEQRIIYGADRENDSENSYGDNERSVEPDKNQYDDDDHETTRERQRDFHERGGRYNENRSTYGGRRRENGGRGRYERLEVPKSRSSMRKESPRGLYGPTDRPPSRVTEAPASGRSRGTHERKNDERMRHLEHAQDVYRPDVNAPFRDGHRDRFRHHSDDVMQRRLIPRDQRHVVLKDRIAGLDRRPPYDRDAVYSPYVPDNVGYASRTRDQERPIVYQYLEEKHVARHDRPEDGKYLENPPRGDSHGSYFEGPFIPGPFRHEVEPLMHRANSRHQPIRHMPEINRLPQRPVPYKNIIKSEPYNQPLNQPDTHPKHFPSLPKDQTKDDDDFIYMVVSMPKSMVREKNIQYGTVDMEKGVKIIGYHSKDGKYTPFEEGM